ncbi:hypothetical protein OG417_53025 [Actinoallomurus sp. NBC_01490]|uniref:hypothetical protein n=1 Tax=Actinoallomurus sp. NBC_01490 TaxID=2903557 RepID=UPI002E347CEF|nr:hypothetical protein [Actinoallomurus sp. NBC_01490]
MALRDLFQSLAQLGDRPGLGGEPLRLLPDALGQPASLGRIGQRRALLGVALPEPGQLLLVPAAGQVVPLVPATAQVDAPLRAVHGERGLERAVGGPLLPPLGPRLAILPAQLPHQLGPFGVAERGLGHLVDEAFAQLQRPGRRREAVVPPQPPPAAHLPVEHLAGPGRRARLVQPPGELLAQCRTVPAARPLVGEPLADGLFVGQRWPGVVRAGGEPPFELQVRLVAGGDLGAQGGELLTDPVLRLGHPRGARRERRFGLDRGLDLHEQGLGVVGGQRRLLVLRGILHVRPPVLRVARRAVRHGRRARALGDGGRGLDLPGSLLVRLDRFAGDVEPVEVQGPLGVVVPGPVGRLALHGPGAELGEARPRRVDERRALLVGRRAVPAVDEVPPQRLEPVLVLVPRRRIRQRRMALLEPVLQRLQHRGPPRQASHRLGELEPPRLVLRLRLRPQPRHARRVHLGLEACPGVPQGGAEDVAVLLLARQHLGQVAAHGVGFVEERRPVGPEVVRHRLERLVGHGVPPPRPAGQLARLAGHLVEAGRAVAHHAVQARLELQPGVQGRQVRPEVLLVEGGLAPGQLLRRPDAVLGPSDHRLVRLGHRGEEVRTDPLDVLVPMRQAGQRLVHPAERGGAAGVLVEPRGHLRGQPVERGGQRRGVVLPLPYGQLPRVAVAEETTALRAQVVAHFGEHRVVVHLAGPRLRGLLPPGDLVLPHLLAGAGQQGVLAGLGAQAGRPAIVQVAYLGLQLRGAAFVVVQAERAGLGAARQGSGTGRELRVVLGAQRTGLGRAVVQSRLLQETVEVPVGGVFEGHAGAQAPRQVVDPLVGLGVEPVPDLRVDPLAPDAEPLGDSAHLRLDRIAEPRPQPGGGDGRVRRAEAGQVEVVLRTEAGRAYRRLQLQLVGQPVGQVVEALLELRPGQPAVQVPLVERLPAGVVPLPHLLGPRPRGVGVDPRLLADQAFGQRTGVLAGALLRLGQP